MDGLIMKYFVLKPKGKDTFAYASRKAMRVYAACIKMQNPLLANEIIDWVRKEEEASQA